MTDYKAPHTAAVAEMLVNDHIDAATSMHIAYVTAEFEREDLGEGEEANMLDIWMAGALLEAIHIQRESQH